MIEVILLERIDRLGALGQTVKVRPGYARNFLLPNKKALRATKANMELFEKQRSQLEAQNAAERAKAEASALKMEGLKLIVIRQASEMAQLFGSVTSRDVAEAASEAGHTVTRGQVHIDTPIKTLGLFPVKIKLHPEVTAKVTVNVARSQDEARVQAEKGAAVTRAAAEKAEVEAAFGAPVEPTETLEGGAAEQRPARKDKKDDADLSVDSEADDDSKAKKPRAKKRAAAK